MEKRYCMGCMREIRPGELFCPKCGHKHDEYLQPEFALPTETQLHAGKYIVGKVLGQGGFGITYVGLDQSLELKVAIKEYFPTSMASRSTGSATLQWHTTAEQHEAGRENFVKEARKMARIHQIPSLVEVRDVFYENGTAYIIMDFVEGETLKARVARTGPMDAKECVTLLRPAMEALGEAHRRGIIHRDVSPDNIMIDRRGAVWVLDMGAAKDLEKNAGAAARSSQAVIKHGFSPLEQYTSVGSVGPWTDVYAMCATIYYCVTGKLVPDAVDRVYEKNASLSASLPDGLRLPLERGLAIRPEERIQSMDELLAALRDIGPGRISDERDDEPDDDTDDNRSDEGGTNGGGTDESDPGKTEEHDDSGQGKDTGGGHTDDMGRKDHPTDDHRKKVPKAAVIGIAAAAAAAVLLAVVLLALPRTSGRCGANATWKLDDGVLTVSGTGEMNDYGDHYGENVPWRKSAGKIVSVEIGDGITRIGSWAFGNCGNLKRVTLPDSVRTIGERAFHFCTNLTDVSLGKGVLRLEKGAFSICNGLTRIELPDSLETIGPYSWANTGLTDIVIPDGVAEIGEFAFFNCTRLAVASAPSEARIADDAFPEWTTVTLRGAKPWRANTLTTDVCVVQEAEDAYTLPALGTDLTREEIRSITFLDSTISAPIECWDVSEYLDGSVLAWSSAGGAGLVDLYIAGEGGVSAPADCSGLFRGYRNLKKIDFNNAFYTEATERMDRMFYDCFALKVIDVSAFDLSQVTSMQSMFYQCGELSELDVSNWNTSNVTDMRWVFYHCGSLRALDVSHWDTSNVTNMLSMFNECESLSALDLSHWDTSNVTNMNWMFYKCSGLEDLDVSSFNTEKVEAMKLMFYGCSGLTSLNVDNFRTSNVTDINGMFSMMTKLRRLDLSGFDTSNVTNMGGVFNGCEALEELDVSGFDTSRATTLDSMFANCPALKRLDVSRFSTDSAEDTYAMFYHCSSLSSLDVSNFDLSRVSNTGHMFNDCYEIKELTIRSDINIGEYMFASCNSLESVTFYGDVTAVGEGAFWGCTTTVHYPAKDTWAQVAGNSYNGTLQWVKEDRAA